MLLGRGELDDDLATGLDADTARWVVECVLAATGADDLLFEQAVKASSATATAAGARTRRNDLMPRIIHRE